MCVCVYHNYIYIPPSSTRSIVVITIMALKGVNILDFTRFQNGPAATVMLADLGATVIKIEVPGVGDTGRGFGRVRSGFSGYFESLNRGKHSLELNLKHEKSRPILNKLIMWADVITENFKPRVLDRLGYGYEYCKSINPKIIYCANSGFGNNGPWSKKGNERGSFDTISQSASGAMVASGGGPSHTPVHTPWGLADQVGALNFTAQILAGIVARERHGVGQKIVCSQLGAMIQFQSTDIVPSMAAGRQRDDGEPSGFNNISLTFYKCGDGKWISVAPCVEESHYPKFCKAAGVEDLLTNERYATPAMRFKRENRIAFRQRLEKHFLTNTADYWVEKIAPVGVPIAPVLDYEGVRNHPQMRENGYIVEVDHPAWGKVSTVGVMGQYSETPAPPVGIAPDLGEHNDEILEKIVHLNKNEIEALKKEGVITPDPKKKYVPPGWMEKHKKKDRKMKSRL